MKHIAEVLGNFSLSFSDGVYSLEILKTLLQNRKSNRCNSENQELSSHTYQGLPERQEPCTFRVCVCIVNISKRYTSSCKRGKLLYTMFELPLPRAKFLSCLRSLPKWIIASLILKNYYNILSLPAVMTILHI